MQGRLSKVKNGILQFLPKNWKKEYDLLNKTNLDYIELFTTKFKDQSPIWNKNNLILKKRINQTKLKKIILCENYVFQKNLLSKYYKHYFNKLIFQLSLFENSLIIIPIENIYFKSKNYQKLLRLVCYLIERSKNKGVEISFEIQCNLRVILKFKKDIKSNFFKITLDTGNIFLIDKKNKNLEYYILGTKNFINHVHLKDRNQDGENVVLGTGLINFKNIIKIFKKIKYNNTFTFETSRGDKFLNTAKHNLKYIKNYFN